MEWSIIRIWSMAFSRVHLPYIFYVQKSLTYSSELPFLIDWALEWLSVDFVLGIHQTFNFVFLQVWNLLSIDLVLEFQVSWKQFQFNQFRCDPEIEASQDAFHPLCNQVRKHLKLDDNDEILECIQALCTIWSTHKKCVDPTHKTNLFPSQNQ